MKKLFAIGLACLCCCLWIGGALAAEAQEPFTLTYEDATLTLMGWHNDTSGMDPTTRKPDGEYLLVRFFVTEGEVPWGAFGEERPNFVLLVGEEEYNSYIAVAQGVKIGDGAVLAVGTIDLIYDVPKGTVPDTLRVALGGENPIEAALGEDRKIEK